MTVYPTLPENVVPKDLKSIASMEESRGEAQHEVMDVLSSWPLIKYKCIPSSSPCSPPLNPSAAGPLPLGAAPYPSPASSPQLQAARAPIQPTWSSPFPPTRALIKPIHVAHFIPCGQQLHLMTYNA
ncbi:hypothetical protein KSP39_PZI009549 [Platanthera zijinensis]|uniref:Uncharacterized protein n=1 Tax=Platanthera zijinensis TaxID=2320716 RepID=A0AAP0BKF7_9ASPA